MLSLKEFEKLTLQSWESLEFISTSPTVDLEIEEVVPFYNSTGKYGYLIKGLIDDEKFQQYLQYVVNSLEQLNYNVFLRGDQISPYIFGYNTNILENAFTNNSGNNKKVCYCYSSYRSLKQDMSIEDQHIVEFEIRIEFPIQYLFDPITCTTSKVTGWSDQDSSGTSNQQENSESLCLNSISLLSAYNELIIRQFKHEMNQKVFIFDSSWRDDHTIDFTNKNSLKDVKTVINIPLPPTAQYDIFIRDGKISLSTIVFFIDSIHQKDNQPSQYKYKGGVITLQNLSREKTQYSIYGSCIKFSSSEEDSTYTEYNRAYSDSLDTGDYVIMQLIGNINNNKKQAKNAVELIESIRALSCYTVLLNTDVDGTNIGITYDIMYNDLTMSNILYRSKYKEVIRKYVPFTCWPGSAKDQYGIIRNDNINTHNLKCKYCGKTTFYIYRGILACSIRCAEKVLKQKSTHNLSHNLLKIFGK